MTDSSPSGSHTASFGPATVVLIALSLVMVFSIWGVRHTTWMQERAGVEHAAERLNANPVLAQFSQACRDVAARVQPSVVHISSRQVVPGATGHTASIATGSGWVFDEAGHIVTNWHVVDGSSGIEVQFHDGEVRSATLVGEDPSTDIAVLQVAAGGLHPAPRVNGDLPPAQGDLVFAFGSPFDFRFSMSAGLVSGLGRSVGLLWRETETGVGYENFIQVDAAINPGNSGGPLTDHAGRVIGMNTAIVASGSPAFDRGQFAGIGLAVPMTMIEPAVAQIIATGRVRKGFMGITVTDLNGSVREWLRLRGFHRFGLLVHHIDQGHPASDAGLQEGDVIEWIGPTRMMATSQLLTSLPEDGDREDIDIKLWRFDPATSTGSPVTIQLHRVIAEGLDGVGVLQLNERLSGAAAPAGRDHAGVLVATVDPTGPAWAAGLLPGDLITSVAGSSVDSVTQLQSRISSIKPGGEVDLEIQRPGIGGGRVEHVTLTVALTSLESMRLIGDLGHERPDAVPHLGIALMRDTDGGTGSTPGVELVELVEGSQLAEAIDPGSVIIRCGSTPIRSIDDLVRVLGQIPRTGRAPIRVLLPDGTTLDHHLYAQ